MLEDLAVLRQPALKRRDVAVGLNRVHPQGLPAGRHPPVGGGPGKDDVVAGVHVEVAEDGLDRRRPALDEDALVTGRVAVERRGLTGDDVGQPHVGVGQHQPPAGHGVDRLPLLPGEQVVQPQVAASSGALGVVRWSGGVHVRASTTAEGTPRW